MRFVSTWFTWFEMLATMTLGRLTYVFNGCSTSCVVGSLGRCGVCDFSYSWLRFTAFFSALACCSVSRGRVSRLVVSRWMPRRVVMRMILIRIVI